MYNSTRVLVNSYFDKYNRINEDLACLECNQTL